MGFWGFETLKTLGFFKLTRFARSFRNRFYCCLEWIFWLIKFFVLWIKERLK
ncbi:hypothetical protein HMPREF1399_00605 [Helicobacter pylori GAM118Bi]|nr:hypothetical protein HMPREF1392_00357 [Helicobacter pylori GAM101Biv]EMG93732.1 hypothetical protein HMPREF1399_00605 [Helicobacter pylori GAM118Bi]EMJ40035.1 hypothetical protein HMPREF1433_01008 [Helicobacter pylori GAMchJs117Ai]